MPRVKKKNIMEAIAHKRKKKMITFTLQPKEKGLTIKRTKLKVLTKTINPGDHVTWWEKGKIKKGTVMVRIINNQSYAYTQYKENGKAIKQYISKVA